MQKKQTTKKKSPAPKKKVELPWEKEKRLKARKQSFIMSYKKGVFLGDHRKMAEWSKMPDIVVRVNKSGHMDDGTEFINITIEGIK